MAFRALISLDRLFQQEQEDALENWPWLHFARVAVFSPRPSPTGWPGLPFSWPPGPAFLLACLRPPSPFSSWRWRWASGLTLVGAVGAALTLGAPARCVLLRPVLPLYRADSHFGVAP